MIFGDAAKPSTIRMLLTAISSSPELKAKVNLISRVPPDEIEATNS